MKKLLSLTLALVLGVSSMVGFATDKAVPILISAPVTIDILLDEEPIITDVGAKVIDGVLMLPLKAVSEALGYKITWNGETRTVEILKGAQWTSVTIGNNGYFRNKMAHQSLSAAPYIVNGRTMVPAEFFVEILGRDIIVEDYSIKLLGEESEMMTPSIHRGFVHKIEINAQGFKTITISSVEGSDDMMNHTILHTSPSTTYFQKAIKEGDFISAASAQFMTMSIPGQTSAYIIY